MTHNDKAQKIERAIRIVWESLDSHLAGTHTLSSTQKKYIDEVGSNRFHQKCIQEYSEVIKTLSELY